MQGCEIVGSFFSSLANVFEQVFFALKNIRLFDVLDILVVAFIIYKCVDFFKKSRAGQLMKGVFMLLLIFLVAQWLDLVSLKWLLNKLIDSAIVVAAIIFQPELRRMLDHLGSVRLTNFLGVSVEDEDGAACAEALWNLRPVLEQELHSNGMMALYWDIEFPLCNVIS